MTPRIGNALPFRRRVGRTLPPWFTTNRVHGHTRLGLRRYPPGTPEATNAAATFKALGADAFTRHAKSGDEDPPWAPGPPPGPNVVRDFIDQAHGDGLRIFAYYWHMSEETLAAEHPDWVCKTHDGRTIKAAKRGLFLDMTGPHGDVVLERLLELARMGADGFLFDFRHLPPRGSWSTALAVEWQQRTGAPPPPPDDASDGYQQFLDFKARRIEETFAHWRNSVHAEHPNVVFIVSTTVIPALTDREMTTRLGRVADSSKNEYLHAVGRKFNKEVFDDPTLKPTEAHVRQALGWTVLRDAAGGRPPHIWARGVPNVAHAKAYAASLVTHGCVANMDVSEFIIGGRDDELPHGKTPRVALQAAFELGNTVSPHMQGTWPVRWAAVHFAERIRNDYGGDFKAAWREVLWPLVGAYQVLTEDGVPVGVVNDEQLENGDLDGYRLLVLTNADKLSPSQQRAVAAFKRRGGRVVENDPTWPWSDPDTGDAAATALRSVLRPHVIAAPLRVTGGPPGRYGVGYRDRERLVVAVTNDFSWVQIRWRRGHENPAAQPATGVRVTWRKGHGLPPMPRPFHRLRAVEVCKGVDLPIVEADRVYHVDLPQFEFMALLVVTRQFQRPRPRPQRTRSA